MITDSSTQKDSDKRKARLYFRLAVVFIFLLSILWAADSSLAFFLAGAFLVCTYLSILYYKRTSRSSYNHHQQSDQTQNHWREPVGETYKHSDKRHAVLPKTIRAVLIGFFVMFFFFFIVGIFSSDNDEAVESFYQQGDLFYNQGTYDSAKIYYQKVLRVQKDHEQALLGYGNTLTALQQYDSAVIVYDKILERDPESQPALYQKGLVLYYANKFDESIAVMKNLVEKNSSYYEAKQVIGDDFYNQKQYDSALVWYNQAYAGGLRNRYLCHLMGYIYDTKDSTALATSLYQEALEYDDSVIDIYIRLGELFPGKEGDAYRAKAKALQDESTLP